MSCPSLHSCVSGASRGVASAGSASPPARLARCVSVPPKVTHTYDIEFSNMRCIQSTFLLCLPISSLRPRMGMGQSTSNMVHADCCAAMCLMGARSSSRSDLFHTSHKPATQEVRLMSQRQYVKLRADPLSLADAHSHPRPHTHANGQRGTCIRPTPTPTHPRTARPLVTNPPEQSCTPTASLQHPLPSCSQAGGPVGPTNQLSDARPVEASRTSVSRVRPVGIPSGPSSSDARPCISNGRTIS